MPTPSLAGFTAPLRRTGVLAAALALLLAAVGPIRAQDKDQGKDPLIAKVNGTEIHQSDLNIAEEEAGQIPPMPEKEKRDYLVQFLADMIVVSKAAEVKKLGDTPDFKRKVMFARNKLLMESLLASTGNAALTDEAEHKVYDDAIKSMGQEQEVHARHILIRAPANDEKASKEAEDKIKAVIVRLKAGEDFAKVAAEVTEDPSGKTNGGDLGYFTKEQMVPEFADVAFSLDKGKISDAVKTQFGWHVIEVEDKRTKPTPKFDEVKSQIEKYVVQKAQTDMVINLRKQAKIERFDEAAKTDATPAKPDAKVDAKPDAKPAKKK